MELQCDSRVKFLTIGYIEWRKGQDILLDAFMSLPQEISKLCQFILIGQDTSVLAVELKEKTKNISEWKIVGKVDRNGIKDYLDKSDMLICPSREDPMPTVAAEAMSRGVPCILSDATGTAKYIHDGIDGIVFRNGDAKQLAKKIEWCVNNRDALRKMGEKSKKIYGQYFTMEVFEKNVCELIESVLKEAGKLQ